MIQQGCRRGKRTNKNIKIGRIIHRGCITVTRRSQQTLRSCWRPFWRLSGVSCSKDQLMMQYCHLVKGFRHALKQLVDISNMLCKLVLVEVAFRFNLRLKQLLFQLISQACLSSDLNWFLLLKCISNLHYRSFVSGWNILIRFAYVEDNSFESECWNIQINSHCRFWII